MNLQSMADVRAGLAGRMWNGEPIRAGGKPNPGTPKDKRLSENKGGKKGTKKPFPGAAPPFKKGS